jgi:hypothetical protein
VDGHWRVHHGQNGQLRNLMGACDATDCRTPHILGFDVIVVGTFAAVAAVMVMVAIYAALTVPRSDAKAGQGP